jgi:uncharacterized protein
MLERYIRQYIEAQNARRPTDVYRFLRDKVGAAYMQFIPCVERGDFRSVAPQHWPACGTAALRDRCPVAPVTPGSD